MIHRKRNTKVLEKKIEREIQREKCLETDKKEME